MELPKIHMRKVAPTGTQTSGCFVSRTDGTGGFEVRDFPVYPPNATCDLIRDLRVIMHISLRQAATALGIGVVEISGLERGHYQLVDEVAGFQEVVRRFIACSDRPKRVLPSLG